MELKFRAWIKNSANMTGENKPLMIYTDKKHGIYYIANTNPIEKLLYCYCILGGNENDVDPCADYYYPKDCILMSFVGHEDKNHKDIYEGDIIKGDPANGVVRYDEETTSYVVVWENWNEGGDSNYLRDIIDDGCIVIGNIYENPELYENFGNVS